MKVINNYSHLLPVNLEKLVRKFLKVIPGEDLAGLDSIILLDEPKQKKYQNVQGMYWKKHKLQPARVEIFINNIYGNHPFLVCLIPCIGKILIAGVLFHELGHHYRHRTHGVSKKENEDFAERYKNKYILKAFYYWLYILRPFMPILNWLSREKN